MTLSIPEYLITLMAIAGVDVLMFLYLWERRKLNVKALILAVTLFAVVTLPLELLFFNGKVWIFGEEYMTHWWFLGLPFEEYLFYPIMVPFIMLILKVVETGLTRKPESPPSDR